MRKVKDISNEVIATPYSKRNDKKVSATIFEDVVVVTYSNDKRHLSTETIYGKILEVTEEQVIIKCLLDEENRIFEVRAFDKEPFEGAVTLEMNRFVEITIETSVGQRIFTYRDAEMDLSDIFIQKNYLEGLENSAFFTALSSCKDDENNL